VRILVRHVTGEFLAILLLCLGGILGIYYVVDIFNHLDIFISYEVPLGTKLSYFLWKLPMILWQVTPVAVLIAMVTVIGLMYRHNELTAIKAAGVSLFAITRPLLLVALGVSGLIFLNNEYLLPFANQQANHIRDVEIKGKPPRGLFRQSRVWYVGRDNTIYNVAMLDPLQSTMEGITLFRLDQDFRLTERIDARKAEPGPDGWVFTGVIRRTFADGGRRLGLAQRLDRLVLPLEERLEDFIKYKKKPDEMSYPELRAYVEKIANSGYNAVPYRVDLLAKTALPFISLVISFLSLGLAVRGSRRGGVVASIGLCIALGVVYWLLISVGLSLGHAGRLPPLLASWGANLLFLAAGVWTYLTMPQ
jgi:lipopolysaccharide export system permease protein